jgi:hypothetical protein
MVPPFRYAAELATKPRKLVLVRAHAPLLAGPRIEAIELTFSGQQQMGYGQQPYGQQPYGQGQPVYVQQHGGAGAGAAGAGGCLGESSSLSRPSSTSSPSLLCQA